MEHRESARPEGPRGVRGRTTANGLRRAGPERAAASGTLVGWRRRLRPACERRRAVGTRPGLCAPGRLGLRFFGRSCSAAGPAATPATAASLLHQTGAELGRRGAARGAVPERLHCPLLRPVHRHSWSLSLRTLRSSSSQPGVLRPGQDVPQRSLPAQLPREPARYSQPG